MLVMGLLALRQKKPFVDVMVDEIPRQDLIMAESARDKEIRIGQAAAVERLTPDRGQLMPNRAGVVAALGAQAFEDAADGAIAARDEAPENRPRAATPHPA